MTITITIDDELVSAYEREDAVNHEALDSDLEDQIRRYRQSVKAKHVQQDAAWALQSFAQLPEDQKAVIMAQLAQVQPPPSQQTGV